MIFWFFQYLSRDIRILELRHQQFGVMTSAFLSHDINILALLRHFFSLSRHFFCYVATLAFLSHDINILSHNISILALLLALSQHFFCFVMTFFFAVSQHYLCSLASFSSPTCQDHKFFVLTRIWVCGISMKRSLNEECNHGGI